MCCWATGIEKIYSILGFWGTIILKLLHSEFYFLQPTGMVSLALTFWASQLVILCCKFTTVVIHLAEKLEFEMLMQMGLNNIWTYSMYLLHGPRCGLMWDHLGAPKHLGYVDLRGNVGLMYLWTLQMKFFWWCGWSKYICCWQSSSCYSSVH